MNKKMLPIYTLKILEQFSDEKHPLLQKDIIRLLEEQYGLVIERKAVGKILNELQDLDYDICYDNGYYLYERSFSKSELHFLTDCVLSSVTLTVKQAKSLLKKLTAKESNYHKRQFRHIHNVSRIAHGLNDEFFYTIECIDEAIEEGKKIGFHYMTYGLDKQLHKKKEEKYIVNPYEMLISSGRYYLVANYDTYDNISHYRIDKITDIQILDEPLKAITTLPEYQNGFHYPQHLIEHIYMFSGPSKRVRIQFKNHIIDQIIDWFGTDCNIERVNDEESIFSVRVNQAALKYWLKQYDEFAKLIEQ